MEGPLRHHSDELYCRTAVHSNPWAVHADQRQLRTGSGSYLHTFPRAVVAQCPAIGDIVLVQFNPEIRSRGKVVAVDTISRPPRVQVILEATGESMVMPVIETHPNECESNPAEVVLAEGERQHDAYHDFEESFDYIANMATMHSLPSQEPTRFEESKPPLARLASDRRAHLPEVSIPRLNASSGDVHHDFEESFDLATKMSRQGWQASHSPLALDAQNFDNPSSSSGDPLSPKESKTPVYHELSTPRMHRMGMERRRSVSETRRWQDLDNECSVIKNQVQALHQRLSAMALDGHTSEAPMNPRHKVEMMLSMRPLGAGAPSTTCSPESARQESEAEHLSTITGPSTRLYSDASVCRLRNSTTDLQPDRSTSVFQDFIKLMSGCITRSADDTVVRRPRDRKAHSVAAPPGRPMNPYRPHDYT